MNKKESHGFSRVECQSITIGVYRLKKREVKRGFNEFRKFAEKKTKYIANCSSCRFMEDECLNSNVTLFDIVEKENGEFVCCFWEGYKYYGGRKNGRKS